MSYDTLSARELLPHYPEHTQTAYAAAGIGAADWDGLQRDEQYDRLLSTVGNTPLLSYQFDDVRGTVHIKQELLSPTESHCDRQAAALYKMEKGSPIRTARLVWIEYSWYAASFPYRRFARWTRCCCTSASQHGP